MLSIVIPAFNEEQMIHKSAGVIAGIMEEAKIEYEMIFVNDGSTDHTWPLIREEAKANRHIRGLCFSRNFGKEAAMFAGLEASRGDCTVVIDCDLQHPPEKIVEMYRLWEQGYEVVEGVKRSRGQESGLHAFAAKTFYRMISSATKVDMSRASDFKLLDKKAVEVLRNMPEKKAFFRALSSWVGFKTIQVEYDVQEREAGESKWSTKSLITYAVTNISSFTTVPLQIITWLGVIMIVVTSIFGIISLVQKIRGTALGGFTTVILLQGFTSGVIMISLGIIGYYMAKIYEEVQQRPRYIVSETTEQEVMTSP